MAYATAVDVEKRLGRTLEANETQIVETRLEDAEILIRSRIKDLDDQVVAGTILTAALVMVEAEAVLRLVRNPEGYSQESEGNYSYTIDERVASGRLEIQDHEWSLLGVRRGIYSIKPTVTIPWHTGEQNPNADFELDTAVWG